MSISVRTLKRVILTPTLLYYLASVKSQLNKERDLNWIKLSKMADAV